MFSSIAEEDTYDQKFYENMLALEQLHSKKSTEAVTSQLVQMYSDSVQYFDTISEPVSVYFQSKLRKIVQKAIPKKQKSLRKKKAEDVIGEEKIISEMSHQVPVEQVIEKHLGEVQAYERKITNIIDQQKEQLQSRRKRHLKRSLTKSASLTMSVDSMFDSPERVDRASRKLDTLNLFQSLIDSEN